MKIKNVFYLTSVLVFGLGIVACKKDIPPTLIVQVVDSEGKALKNATVHAHPGDADQSVVNVDEMDQTETTGASGEATFEFKYSAVLDIDVWYLHSYTDSLLNPVTDTLTGKKVVKVEVKRQRGKTNETTEVVEVN